MASETGPSLVWLRNDLRLTDQPAMERAVQVGGPVIPVFVWSPDEEEPWLPGGASRWWLHHSLVHLDGSLRRKGSRLVIRRGPALECLAALARETGARAVFWNRRYEPATLARDRKIKESLRGEGYQVESSNSALLVEPWTLLNQSRLPFQVFTPFWKAAMTGLAPSEPVPEAGTLPAPKRWPSSETIDSLGLLPTVAWDAGLRAAWTPGEGGARALLDRFVDAAVFDYGDRRDRPDLTGTSRLSPHLHFGEIGPRQIWHAVRKAAVRSGMREEVWRGWRFVTELGWREFAHYLLFHFPETQNRPLRREFERMGWRSDEAAIEAWRRGRTGVPLVDAGMRELWTTGWMHNRVRMVVGSFLVKNLLISWQTGAKWFWDTLVDADVANNTLGWQWVAGCGADAAPYFRVFNPVSQGRKFDPHGDYVRRWIPELRRLPETEIHAPWEAPEVVLRGAGVRLGTDYPMPVVSLNATRIAALAAFAALKTVRSGS